MNKPSDEKDFIAAPAPTDALAEKINADPRDEHAKPPRARVSDAIDEDEQQGTPRQRDYLEGFLSAAAPAPAQGGAGGELQQAIVDALKEIYDPEIPVNIYDLGLIYGVEVDDESDATVTMTLTTPNCPVAETMPGEVELRAASVPGVRDAEVVLVWDPPWSPEKMSDEARLELGML